MRASVGMVVAWAHQKRLNAMLRLCAISVLLCVVLRVSAAEPAAMTLGEARMLMRSHNPAIKLARSEVDVARNQRLSLGASWFPTLGVKGGYVYMSNPIEVRQSLGAVVKPSKEIIEQLFPDNALLGEIFSRLGGTTLSFPLTPRGLMSVDATLVWPIFAGGRRLYVGRLGREIVSGATVASEGVEAELQVRLVESYYGVTLATRVLDVRRRSLAALELHLRNARRMASEGVLGATELLVVEVATEDARSELLAAENNVAASQTALRGVLGVDTTDIVPVTPMFVADSLPSPTFFRSSAESNYLVRGLSHQITAAELRRRMSRGGYAPTVALLGKQTIYSHGINRHLMPRSVVGVGVTWTLFDGLQREHEIGAARLAVVNSRLAHSSALSQTSVAIERLLAELHNAAARVRSGRRTVALNHRVLDNRRREWNEGVATLDRVVDAEVALASARVALLAAYYAYDVALMGLLAVCGCPDMFYELAARAVDVPSYDE